METKDPSLPFIFYLNFTEYLPANFYVFDRVFKDLGFVLIPVKIDQLQTLVSLAEQSHVIVLSSTMDMKEYKLYNERVRGLLKFILRSKRMTYMHLSSFAKLNDTKSFALFKNYYFLKYPLDASVLAARIGRYYDFKQSQNSAWPGGKRAGLTGVCV